jgi:hypothetical protein
MQGHTCQGLLKSQVRVDLVEGADVAKFLLNLVLFAVRIFDFFPIC